MLGGLVGWLGGRLVANVVVASPKTGVPKWGLVGAMPTGAHSSGFALLPRLRLYDFGLLACAKVRTVIITLNT